MGANREKAEELYRKIVSIQMELVATKDKDIAKLLLSKIEKYKKEIESIGENEYIEKAGTVSYKKYDSRIPAFKSHRQVRMICIIMIILFVSAGVAAGSYYAYTTDMADKRSRYENAVAIMKTDFEEAYQAFTELGDFEQSSTYAEFCALCMELESLEASSEPVRLSAVNAKLEQLDGYNLGVDFENLRKLSGQATALLGTYWEGGEYVDEVSHYSFIRACRISDRGDISVTTLRTDGYMNDSLWSIAETYSFHVANSQLCAVNNRYDWEKLFFYDDHVLYQHGVQDVLYRK